MSLFHAKGPPLSLPRDDLIIPQFIIDELPSDMKKPTRPPNVPCFIDEETGRAVFLAELQMRTDALAKAFYGRWNICLGDVVSLYAPNHVDYIVIVWAVHRLGGIVATHSSALTREELVEQLEIAKPTALIAHADNLHITEHAASSIRLSPNRISVLDGQLSTGSPYPSIDELIQENASSPSYSEVKFQARQAIDAIAFLCYSSGTTGKSKAVAISHYNVICNITQNAIFNRVNDTCAHWKNRPFSPGDVAAGVLPWYHIYGLVINLHFLIYCGMTIVVSKKFVYENFLQSIDRYRITHLTIVPPQAVLFCKHPATGHYDLSSVRYCLVAAAPMTAELTEQLLNIFPQAQLGQGYGMTETCVTVTTLPPELRIGTPGSCGRLITGTVAKVVKPDGSMAGVGEPGELYIKGPQVALGYYRNEKATNETFVHGWIRTGDEVVFRENGDMFVTGRIKELIKVKGNQVAPAELEGHLLTHPVVADAAIIGVADDYSGEVPLAFIVLKPEVAIVIAKDDSLAADVRKLLYQHVATAKTTYKWLNGGIEFINAIPKNPSGKILRRVLREYIKDRRSPNRARL